MEPNCHPQFIVSFDTSVVASDLEVGCKPRANHIPCHGVRLDRFLFLHAWSMRIQFCGSPMMSQAEILFLFFRSRSEMKRVRSRIPCMAFPPQFLFRKKRSMAPKLRLLPSIKVRRTVIDMTLFDRGCRLVDFH